MNQNTKEINKEFSGLSISSGKVVAPACLYSIVHNRNISRRTLKSDEEVDRELERFDSALAFCSSHLEKIAVEASETVGMPESQVFITQKNIMNDAAIVEAVRKLVREQHINIEQAINHVYNEYEDKFAGLDNEYLRERSTDMGEIRRRLLDRLNNTSPGFACKGQVHCSEGRDSVIVAEELSADMMVHMDLTKVLAIVTEHGGISSHAAIIARSVGIPAVTGVKNIMEHVGCRTKVLVDGDEGCVIVNPTEEVIRQCIPAEPVRTDDVCVISTPEGMGLYANASLVEDVHHAEAFRADGIGLFRTEIIFMRAERLLDENEQYEYYSQVRDSLPGKPVTFRLLDVGGDKELPFLRIEKESNPYLGWRGARFLLGSPEVFSAQVRGLLRLSETGPVKILFPMIVDARQFEQLRKGVLDLIPSTRARAENVKIGAMFEVPSACYQAEKILSQADFASIGSNDLLQYLFAVDRNNELVSSDYNPEHPVLWDVLRDLSSTARRMNKPITICGEMAGRKGMATRLLDTGLRLLSVSPRLIPRVRNEMAEYARREGKGDVLYNG
ncbi:MAG: phosphoenolpyruvate--protein phosphotransferase [Chitinivibrionales bacterium]|nr:phosphoenolpyruvate--protein phosphotransferase [Chitinivibrionales bacterium]